ncbi:PEP-CTERM motif protein [Marinobacter litoralis]|uniref:PEP-CTERM motif protein n=1 Tax=Marinobacter litoralis TaxID=187981 RepID=A0A3M2RET1_9GAMM|nr:PEP-CTERM sorting domain-containing protein [Marinobacter litoralis]RMJ03821.1 PEP-CTERM motif protein [Marinobacter litoralis]
MKKHNKLLSAVAVGAILGAASLPASAHLVSFGWKDQGNGTIIMYGQHWHGDQLGPSTANGGVRIGVFGTDHTTWQLFQWTGHINNWGGNTAQNDALVTNGELDGYAVDPGNWTNSSFDNDWFYTDPLVLGDGTWGLFTGTNCCIDTMSSPGEFVISGIGSVDPGTGPGTDPGTPPSQVPEPGTIGLLGAGLLSLLAIRRRKQ